MNSPTVQELTPEQLATSNALITQSAELLAKYKRQKDRAEKLTKLRSARLEAEKKHLLKMMEAIKLENFGAFGYNFSVSPKVNYSLPETLSERKAFFDFLTENQLFWEYATVHSSSLQSLCGDLMDKATAEQNIDYEIPGIIESDPFNVISMRAKSTKGKNKNKE